MTDIEYTENKELLNEPLVNYSTELLNRYLLDYSPEIHFDILKQLFDNAIKKISLCTKKQLPEINVNNALIMLRSIGYKFVVGIDADNPEEHRISVPFPLSIESVVAGTVKYESGWPSTTLVRALYVKIIEPVTKTFSLTNMSLEESSELWSWAVGRLSSPMKKDTPEWVTWEKIPEMKPLELIKDTTLVALAKELEGKTGVSFMVPMSIFYVTMSIAGYSAFVDSIIMGKDYDELMKQLDYRLSVSRSHRDNEQALVNERYMKSVFMYFASIRLKESKYKELVEKIELSMTLNGIKSLLPKDDVIMIEKAIEEEDKKMKAMTNNPCTHRKSIKSLELSNNADDKRKIINEIKTNYLPDNYEKSMIEETLITCKKCHYPLICPHSYLLQKGLSELKSLKEIRETVNDMIYPDKIKGNYVCRICGENIISLSAFDTVIDQYNVSGYDEDPEISMLWSEVSFMTRYIVFDNLINKNMFVTSIVSLIWPLIDVQVTKILSSKGSSADEILAKKRVNNAIYILAAFINLAVASETSTDKNVVKVSLDYPENTTGRTPLQKMFAYASNIIMDSLKVHIRKIPGTTTQTIVSELVRAYSAIDKKKKGPIVQVYDPSGSTDVWMNNSWFYYVAMHTIPIVNDSAMMKLLDTIAPFADPPKKESTSKKKTNKKIIKIRQEVPFKTSKFTLTLEHLSPSQIVIKYAPKPQNYIPKAENKVFTEFLRQWNKYYGESFIVMVDYTKNVFPKMGFIDSKDNEAMASINKNKDIQLLHRYEENAIRLLRMIIMKNVDPLPDKRRYYVRTTSPLGYIYTDDGLRRIFKQFGPWQKTGAKSWKLNEGDEPLVWKDTTGYSYGDKVSSDSNIMAAIQEQEKVGNMIQFYEFICPKGDSHTFEKKTCTKCGYVQDSSGKEYYTKYLQDYLRDKEMVSGKILDTIVHEKIVIHKKPVVVHNIDHAAMIEAAKFCGVPISVIESIGSYEGVSYKQILDEKHTPPVTTDKMANRPDKIRACCMQLITRYGAFVNIANNYSPPKELTDLLNDIHVPKNIMSVTEFADNFMEDYETVFYNNGAKDLVEFALGSFIRMIFNLKAIQDAHKELSDVIKWIINGPLSSERLGTVPIITNWSAILKSLKEKADTNTDTTAGPTKEVDEDAEQLDYGDGLDLEDAADTEDASNQIKFKEE